VHWKVSARRTGKATWAGRRQLLFTGEILIDTFVGANDLESRNEVLNEAGDSSRIDLSKLRHAFRLQRLMPDAYFNWDVLLPVVKG